MGGNRTTKSPAVALAVLLSASAGCLPLALAATPALAQNNTAPFSTGTNCADLPEPRRSACKDAFDPRTNPREWQKRGNPSTFSPPEPSALGRPPATIAPKAPYQPLLHPTPALPRFKPPG
ncbi:hypothetical protein A8950_1455 [Dongia mobilis]|uniref:Uncharacterized protein n=1 Tax=Dongia mobilis TaxID=578943 RepID=A0A4V3DEU4_9PROT|nr:hypothetical protein [Dongia mobilis]TDQ83170.1 hypothetical protein A8950_1455 [Dongia mobilis]